MKRETYKEDYHNNVFNFMISKNSDNLRTIMDLDCFITKFNCPYYFIVDHKKMNDNCSLNLYRTLSNLANVQLNDKARIKCFIVRSDIELINDNRIARTKNAITYIQEINNNIFSKDKKDYIKEQYTITNDDILCDFFKPEKHDETLIKISAYKQLTCF